MWYDMGANEERNYIEEDAKRHDEWIVCVKNRLSELEKPSVFSIHKVPSKLRKLKEAAYSPIIVSIGPFHHRNEELLGIEEHKWRYMLHLLHRTSQAGITTLHECASAVLGLEQKARGCYSEYISYDKHKLVEILLFDGFFILELFMRYSESDKSDDHVEVFEDISYDPIINNVWTVPTLQHDLALLENQIPFFVLETLFDIIKKYAPKPLTCSFTKKNVATLATLFFKSALGLTLSDQLVESKSSNLTGDHLLDILHKFYLGTSQCSPINLRQGEFKVCATEFLKVGIQFQSETTKENLLDINFTGGVVKMPPLCIQEATESIFRNLIAFEQRSFGSSDHIASYAFLMRSLLRSSQDVELLQKNGIIRNDLSEDVPNFFKCMCDGVVLNDFYFSRLCEEVNDYSRSWLHWRRLKAIVNVKCHEYMLILRRDFFPNPWSIISFIAAVVLLIFTAMQTYYAARSYYH
ncbi:UPF0481 protein [Camellia lanceoleosa]|uniref:UPF0481 protein n=1 Tax=Camellia lanceoleosa TaxID=1840588 RepID=A0ACC0GAM6_9ERIC|nr:UPF0481 protein [Camellia lanceoleosa]